MSRIKAILPLLLLTTLAAGCENGPPWSSADPEGTPDARPDFGPTAAYGRRLLFMGPGAQLPTAALFDFTTLSDSTSVRRGVRSRLLVDNTWRALLDAGWEHEPLREPWRILPGDELRIIVTDAGEIAALAVQGDSTVRLEPGPTLAETSPDAGTRLALRQSTLRVGDRTIRGILLDSQLGRAVRPSAVPQPLSAATEGDGPADSIPEPPPGRPTPIARPGVEGLLLNNSGYYAVFTTSSGGDIAWISQGGRDEIRRGALLEPTGWSGEAADTTADTATDTAAVRMPTGWRIGGPGADLDGSLTAEATSAESLAGLGELEALGYVLVSGWIEDRGVRRDVFGLLRHVR